MLDEILPLDRISLPTSPTQPAYTIRLNAPRPAFADGLGRVSFIRSRRRQLAVYIRDEGDHQYLFSPAITTGRMRTIRDVGSGFAARCYQNPGIRFSVSPNGGNILYLTCSTKTGLWMLERFEQP